MEIILSPNKTKKKCVPTGDNLSKYRKSYVFSQNTKFDDFH